MTIFKQEIRSQKLALLIWSGAIGAFVAICVFLFPNLGKEADKASEMFSSMGSFSAAFGMDKLDIGTISGFYAVESGNILGIGGAFFAAIVGISALMKEEKERTASFLFMHPASRKRIISEKLVSTAVIIVLLNAVIFIFAVGSLAAIGEIGALKDIGLIHVAQMLLQLEIAGICFGISAYIKRAGIGIGIGIAAFLYFLNIVANMTSDAKALKYITPFGYTEGSDIISTHSIELKYLIPGMIFMTIGIVIGYIKYMKKDLSE
jgi:ABC-2 type transport system permease protein